MIAPDVSPDHPARLLNDGALTTDGSTLPHYTCQVILAFQPLTTYNQRVLFLQRFRL